MIILSSTRKNIIVSEYISITIVPLLAWISFDKFIIFITSSSVCLRKELTSLRFSCIILGHTQTADFDFSNEHVSVWLYHAIWSPLSHNNFNTDIESLKAISEYIILNMWVNARWKQLNTKGMLDQGYIP